MHFARLKISSLVCLIALLLLSLPDFGVGGSAQGKSQGNKTPFSPIYNVTSKIYDFADYPANLQQVLFRSDDRNATALATYSTSDAGVASFVGGTAGEWQLDLSQQTLRTVYVSFSNPVSGSADSPVPSGYYNATIFSRCYDQNLNLTGWLTIAAGTTNNLCAFRVNITYKNTKYSFVMGPNVSGTGWAAVTCNATSATTGCTSWTVVPSTATSAGSLTNNATVANLYTTARNGSQILVGTYHNTFRVDVTNP